ncbi:MAG: hypothetical protein ACXW6T_09125 [Candidatus Binatia bacterium]
MIADLTLLTASKLPTQAIENKFRDPLSGGRRVNFDPRYIPSPESRSRFDQQCQSAHRFRIPLLPKRGGDKLFNHWANFVLLRAGVGWYDPAVKGSR